MSDVGGMAVELRRARPNAIFIPSTSGVKFIAYHTCCYNLVVWDSMTLRGCRMNFIEWCWRNGSGTS